jgi:glycosyltransferase involved in cell wall biosynthesis
MKDSFYYIANIRLPTEKAHGIQIMEMCNAFADLGTKLELIVPNRKTIKDGKLITEDPFKYYGVNSSFKITRLWCLDWVKWRRWGFIIQSLSFTLTVVWSILFKRGIFYTRDELIAACLKILKKRVVWEAHMGQQNLFVKFLINRKVPFVVITQGLKNLYVKLGVSEKLIHVAPDGVSLEKFIINESRDEARKRFNFDLNSKLILYTGHLYSWKGADTLAQTAGQILSCANLIFIGGTDKHIQEFKDRYKDFKNIKILGKKPHQEMPIYLRSADILVLPNSSKEDISKLYTSPMKLFEYMASGVPIIASDLPSLKEVLDENNAYFFKPDDDGSLARVINKVFLEYGKAELKAKKALKDVYQYSWKNRAKNILIFESERKLV